MSASLLNMNDEVQSWHSWVGSRVCISGIKYGVLRYFGETKFSPGLWCGVELDEPVGKNNGIVKGVRYFTCKEQHGIFAPLAKTMKVIEDDSLAVLNKPAHLKLPSKMKYSQKRLSYVERSNRANSNVRSSLLPGGGIVNNKAIMNKTFQGIGSGTIAAEQLPIAFDTNLNNVPQDFRLLDTGVRVASDRQSFKPSNTLKEYSSLHDQDTVFNSDYNKNVMCQRAPGFDATFLCADETLTSSLKAFPENLPNSLEPRNFDCTFVLDHTESEVGHNETKCHKADSEPFGFAENFSMLPNKMKELTMDFENTYIFDAENPPSILKKELCVVNDLPESAVVSYYAAQSAPDSELTDMQSSIGKGDEVADSTLKAGTLLGTDEPLVSSHEQSSRSNSLDSSSNSIARESLPGVDFNMSDLDQNKDSPSESIHWDVSSAFIGKETLPSVDFNLSELDKNSKSSLTNFRNSSDSSDNQSFTVQDDPVIPDCHGKLENYLSFLGSPFVNQNTLEGSDLINFSVNYLSFLGPAASPVNRDGNTCFDSPLLKDVSLNADNVPKPNISVIESLAEVKPNDKLYSSPTVEKLPAELIHFCDKGRESSELPKVEVLESENQESSGGNSEAKVCDIDLSSHVLMECQGSSQAGFSDELNNTKVAEEIGSDAKQASCKSASELLINIPGTGNEGTSNVTQDVEIALNNAESAVPLNVTVPLNDLALTCEDTDKSNCDVLCNEGEVNTRANVVLNETVCLRPASDDQVYNDGDISEPKLQKTFIASKAKSLPEVTSSPITAAADNAMDGNQEKHSVESHQPSPLFQGRIEDISVIVGANECFEISGMLDHEVPSPNFNEHNATFHAPNISLSPIKDTSSDTVSKKAVSASTCASKAVSNQLNKTWNTLTPQKRDISKRKTIAVDDLNQENIEIRTTAAQRKKEGSGTPKLNAKNKSESKEVSNNTNRLVRHSTPKVSTGRCAFKKVEKPTPQSDAPSLKNSLIPQRGNELISGDAEKKEGRILTQLQNVSRFPKTNNKFKVPQLPLKKRIDGSKLPSPSGSATSASSIPSLPKAEKARRNILSIGGSTTPVASKPSVPQQSLSKPQILPQSKYSKSRILPPSKTTTNTDSKGGRWTTKPPEQKKFVSKTELVKEIQELGANCENRTKELNLLKMRLRHAALGFEAMAVLNKYMMEEFDPFSQPRLARQYEKAKQELSILGQQLHLYQSQLNDLQAIHAEELMELTEKLGVVHEDEINELKSNHVAELAEVDRNHKQQMKRLREDFKKQAEENEEHNCRLFRELQEDYQKQKKELEENHAKKLREVTSLHEEVQQQLQKRLESLNEQYSSLQKQLREAEEAFMKDKNSKIQYISAKKTELEKEVDSLKAVLEIKTTQIQDLHKENFKIKKELEELPAAKEKIRKLETKTEDLKALMQEKVKLHRELSTENQQLVLVCEKEAKNNSRLSMANEELLWRLQRSMEVNARSTSLCASPDLWNRDDEDQRSSSRMSLPILQSEKQRSNSGASSPARGEEGPPAGPRVHSMSMSWHPALPTHAESPSAPPLVRERSRSARGARLPPQGKLSALRLKKEIEADILRRNSCSVAPAPSSMSMSWGGETFADYYEELDDQSMQAYSDQRSGMSRKFFIRYDLDKPRKGKRSRRSVPATFHPDGEIDIDRSISGLASMQSSFHSSTDSSSSYLPTQPGSEASNSSSPSSDNKSQDSSGFLVAYDGPPPSCVKPPQELAGESMIQEMESVAQALLKGHLKKEALTDASSSSPEDGRDNGANVASVATPSVETSSQGMADSTNLDVSWGDEEMMSEND